MSMMDINSKKADPPFSRIFAGLFPILVVPEPPEMVQFESNNDVLLHVFGM